MNRPIALCCLLPSLVLGEAPIARAAADEAPAIGTHAAADHIEALPRTVDLRPALAELRMQPRRQGGRGTCSVFTTVAALEFALSRRSGRLEPLSPEYLNWAANQITGNHAHDRGQFFHNLLKGFEKFGICSERELPYAERIDPALAPSLELQAHARRVLEQGLRVHWIRRWTPEQGLSDEQFDQIKRVLAAGWPVAAGSDHSRLLVGYADQPDQPGGGQFATMDSGSGRFDAVSYEFAKTKIGDAFWVESSPADEPAQHNDEGNESDD